MTGPVSLIEAGIKQKKTYNSRDSLVVTHPTTNRPACGLSTAERTGSPVFHTLWSYVLVLKEIQLVFELFPGLGDDASSPEQMVDHLLVPQTSTKPSNISKGKGSGQATKVLGGAFKIDGDQ
jgi:hypothetical protein